MRFLKQGISSLTSINIDPDYATWSDVATYSALDKRLYETNHYMSVIDSNLDNTPSENEGKWLLWEVANQFALLDLQSETATVCNVDTITSGSDYDLTIEVDVTGMDTLIIGNAVGSALEIVEKNVSDATIETTNKTIDETQENPSINLVLELSPTVTKAFITVTELTTGGYSSLGALIGGSTQSFGDTIYNPSLEFNGEVKVTRDPSDIIDIELEDEQDSTTVDIAFDADDTITMIRNSKALRGVPCGWILDDDTTNTIYEGLAVIGYLDDFTMVLKNPIKTFVSIEIKETT